MTRSLQMEIKKWHLQIIKVKVKLTLEQVTNAQRGNSGVVLLYFNLCARRGGWSTPRPGRFTPGKTRYPFYRTGREISGRQVAIGDQIFSFGDRHLAVFSKLDLCEKNGGQTLWSGCWIQAWNFVPWYRRLGKSQGRSGLVWKNSPLQGFDPRTVQPVASRYTNWAIPVPCKSYTVVFSLVLEPCISLIYAWNTNKCACRSCHT
jgi:hypothetical protein